MLRYPLALIRMTLAAVLLVLATLLVVPASLIPWQWREAPLAGWVATFAARLMLMLFNVQVEIEDRERLRTHRGFIFPSHDTFLDIVIPIAIVPMRFLAALEVKDKPLVGLIATAIGVVYVNRSDKNSRKAARESLVNLKPYPPIVLYPEGILDGTPGVSPFRFGAFEIAQQNGLPYIPVALIYSDFWRVRWKNESMLWPIWRVAQLPRVRTKMVPLPTVQPQPGDDPAALARAAERAVLGVLATRGGPDYADLTLPTVSGETP